MIVDGQPYQTASRVSISNMLYDYNMKFLIISLV